MYVLIGELQLKLQNELVDYPCDDFRWQIAERYGRIETVAEFWRKHLFDCFVARIFLADIVAKTDAFLSHVTGPGIGRHNQDDIAEINCLAMMIGKAAVIHDLQQNVEQVGVRLFDFIEQQYTMRALVDCIGEQSALVEADITRRSTDQAAYAVPFHIFGHIEPLKRNTQNRCQLPRYFGFTNAGWAAEQIATNRFFGIAKTGAAKLDRTCQHSNCLVLPKHDTFQVGFKTSQGGLVIGRNLLGRNTRNSRNNRLDLASSNHLAAF